ncbi:UDP-N-acetylglucosamine 2-epimerase (non-hydrolyzing) [Amycolatopsis antarctica]|uniref:UDP-N-acetylglucosamine 2-epimerase (non-hydrolyzing) n=1 Tax=Amycolatopsis antarctica TaxID=1854586 RepID=A0A263D978_9PSEU|nr:UDP-N-acetylglucosamine 2-epimerase (non-hydrolyzing) [Amycolatopsis antarctica]OZM75013.1 UDP-N-acetylglucosamine 2-epimerase (non-hydrolyzing) [Amycolatopsis antarctica]
MEIMLLAGTRPEAVKVAPLVHALRDHPRLTARLVHSGQHQDVVDQAFACFGLTADDYLRVPGRSTGTQAELVSGLLPEMERLLRERRPAAVVVQGDTSTVLAGALSAFWLGIPVVHLEAGLRTYELDSPFPEEGNRQMVSRIAALHLAPTAAAATALRAEGVPADRIALTGNTVVDAVLRVAATRPAAGDPELARLEAGLRRDGRRLVLVTSHRRESWGEPMDRTLDAVRRIVARHPDVEVLLPLHPNPAVRSRISAGLGGVERVTLTEPLGYADLIGALRLADLVLTDSGGIQEEAPTFGTPVLVLREVTERREAVDAGSAWLVGTDADLIVKTAGLVLDGQLTVPAGVNPFGDGTAALRSVTAIDGLLAAA